MGGHGALVSALRNPDRYRSVSAFAPICAPTRVPWGQKAFGGYLGADHALWSEYDATALVEHVRRPGGILIDQGTADKFLAEQLRPELFSEACQRAGQQLRLRMQPGYDHSYWFIQTFMPDHMAWHAAALGV
jgi:S-formylglutathione hydrolase